MQRKQMWECDVCGLKNYNTRNLCFMRNRTGCTGVNPETGLDGCLSLALSAEWLCEACGCHDTLVELDLAWNSLGVGAAAAVLASSLAENVREAEGLEDQRGKAARTVCESQLARLDLSHNGVDGRAGVVLAQALKRGARSMTWVSLAGNPVGRLGAGALLEALAVRAAEGELSGMLLARGVRRASAERRDGLWRA